MKAGYFGESRTDQIIEEVQFQQPVTIIPDFHTRIHPTRYIQVDTLLITQSYILILEIKNIIGTISFKSSPSQIIRTKDSETMAMQCPLVQLDRNIDGIKKILEKYKLNVPLHAALIFPSQNTIVGNAPLNRTILFAKQLPLFIQKLNELPKIFTEDQYNLIIKILKNHNKNFTPKPQCERFDINPEELKKGLLCQQCGALIYRQTKRKWTCIGCQHQYADPIPNNIEDIFMLIKHNIKMKDCIHYLNIKSRHTIYHSLQKMQLQKTGNKKSTYYTIIHTRPLIKQSKPLI